VETKELDGDQAPEPDERSIISDLRSSIIGKFQLQNLKLFSQSTSDNKVDVTFDLGNDIVDECSGFTVYETSSQKKVLDMTPSALNLKRQYFSRRFGSKDLNIRCLAMLYKTPFYIVTFEDRPNECEHHFINEDGYTPSSKTWGKSNEYSGRLAGEFIVNIDKDTKTVIKPTYLMKFDQEVTQVLWPNRNNIIYQLKKKVLIYQ
jgi:hypothetical protein